MFLLLWLLDRLISNSEAWGLVSVLLSLLCPGRLSLPGCGGPWDIPCPGLLGAAATWAPTGSGGFPLPPSLGDPRTGGLSQGATVSSMSDTLPSPPPFVLVAFSCKLG